MLNRSVEIAIAVIILGLALAAAVLWVPFDSETPPIYTFRRQTNIGDAFLPLFAAGGMAIFAFAHLLLTAKRNRVETESPPFDALSSIYLMTFLAIIVTSLALMFWSGPALLALIAGTGEDAPSYREMRDTAPWKYAGFVVGGTTMVFGLITFIEGRLRFKRLLVAILSVLVLIGIFDVPFDTILLPPNGDF